MDIAEWLKKAGTWAYAAGLTWLAVQGILQGNAYAVIIVAVLGGTLGWVWYRGADLRWFRDARISPQPEDIFKTEWGYYTEGEPSFRLYRKDSPLDGTAFAIGINLFLPGHGGRQVYEEAMKGFEAWMEEQPASMRLRGQLAANGQWADVEFCLLKSEAEPGLIMALYEHCRRKAEESYTAYGRRYIRVGYPEYGHVFHAAFDGFSIDRAVIEAGKDTAFIDLGNERHNLILSSEQEYDSAGSDALAEQMGRAFSLYAEDNALEKIRQSDVIPEEEFGKIWCTQPTSVPSREERYPGEEKPGNPS